VGGGKSAQPSGFTNVTQTQNTAPWQPQQAYLQDIFGQAQSLYQGTPPQYYPGSTVAQPNSLQTYPLGYYQGLTQELMGAPLQNTLGSLNNILTGGGFSGNPAVDPLTSLSQSNEGLSNPGSNVLQNLIGGNSAYANPAYGSLANMATGGLSGIGNLASSSIAPSQATMFSGLAPSIGTLGSFASGSQTDPFLSNVAQSTLANVVPSIESQFIQGGGLSSPQAAYATSQGASAALAPVISNALLQEQQNQLGAAGTLGNLGIAGGQALQNLSLNPAAALSNLAGLQAGIGQGLGSQIMQGQGLQQQGAGTLGNLALGGAGLQTQQLGDIGNLYSNAMQQQLQAAGLMPSTMQGAYIPAQEMQQAGNQYQQLQQQQLSDLVNRWNYNQTLPYQALNTFLGQVSGNYGGTGTGTTSSPYYINQGTNLLSGGLGGGLIGNALFPAASTLPGAAAGASTIPFGGIGGGLVGALLSGLIPSDRRLKTDVRRIGTAANGLPLYLFRFHGSPVKHIGAMADEVEKVRPDAVYDGPMGLKLVDYEKALA
jgi:hypothetical protein